MTEPGMLEGIRVLDLTQGIAGPYCTKLLAGLGADVVKVEKPKTGDITRMIGPFPNNTPDPRIGGFIFLYLNTNKKSITIDLGTVTGQKLFKGLVSEADIIVESFKPGVMDSFGLGYDTLSALNPGVVMTSISSFGQNGPRKDYEATELTLYAMSGLLYITGEPGQEPIRIGTEMAQYIGGQNAFAATLATFYNKEVTGEGQYVDVAIAECNAGILEYHLSQYVFKDYVPTRIGYANEKGHPHGMFPCKDGWVALHVRTGAGWPAAVKLTGIKELDRPEFASDQGRITHRDEVDAYLMPWLLERTKGDIEVAWNAAGLTASKVHDVGELLQNPHLVERDFFVDIEHPATGILKYPSGPYKVDGKSPWRVQRAPLLGEHNKDVIGQMFHYSDDALLNLAQQGII